MVDLSRALAIKGWMSRAELTWLAEQAAHARLIVEFGSWQGDYPTDAGGVHRTIRTDVFALFATNLGDHLETGRVVPIPLPSDRARQRLLEACGPGGADLVFIDGDHRYETVLADIDLARALVRPGGIIAGHDYGHRDWPGVQRAVDEQFPALAGRVDSLWWVEV